MCARQVAPVDESRTTRSGAGGRLLGTSRVLVPKSAGIAANRRNLRGSPRPTRADVLGSTMRKTGLSAGFRCHALQAGGRWFEPGTAHRRRSPAPAAPSHDYFAWLSLLKANVGEPWPHAGC